jgi:hypothetical protein
MQRVFLSSKSGMPTPAALPDQSAGRNLEVNVIFTTNQSTARALKIATRLALDLDARIRLIVTRFVPYAFPLNRPPVSIAFTEQHFARLVANAGIGPAAETLICNCRDRRLALVQLLPPGSLVVMGCREHWWPTVEVKLARRLRAAGHEVILAGPQGRTNVGLRLFAGGRAAVRSLLGIRQSV